MSERFTVVFAGDIRKFGGNPFHADTPFGRPIIVDADDAVAERDALYEALSEIVGMHANFSDAPEWKRARAALLRAQASPGQNDCT